MATTTAVGTTSWLRKIRDGLAPKEWARLGGMVATIIGFNILGWGMLAAALGGHFHINKTEIFGVGRH